MFGLLTIIPPWGWQLIIAILKATGLTDWAGALSIKLVVALANKLENVQTYHENSDFPDPYPASTTMHNFVVGGQG